MVVQAVILFSAARGSSRRYFTRTTPGPASTDSRKVSSLSSGTSVSVSSTALSMMEPSPKGTSPLGFRAGMSSPAFVPFSSR